MDWNMIAAYVSLGVTIVAGLWGINERRQTKEDERREKDLEAAAAQHNTTMITIASLTSVATELRIEVARLSDSIKNMTKEIDMVATKAESIEHSIHQIDRRVVVLETGARK